MKSYDFIIVGAGIMGLTLAHELATRKAGSILILEKEGEPGLHASGRNSGVVHCGIYYSADSMKAKFSVEGHRRMIEYVEARQLPILKCGKVIVAQDEASVKTLATLMERAKVNGVKVQRVSVDELRELEPQAFTNEWAIWCPQTAVVDSKAILKSLVAELREMGVTIEFGHRVFAAEPARREISTTLDIFQYGKLINAAGVYADEVAHLYGSGMKYRILPFKGMYWKAGSEFGNRIQRLIYPAPDMGMPFLGLHVTRTLNGYVLFGPTAMPALGRENYGGLGGMSIGESAGIGWNLFKSFVRNTDNIRGHIRREMSHYSGGGFFREAQKLVPALRPADIGSFYKAGIRSQLMNVETGKLEMDFIVEKGENSLHILNAVSPAFTASFAMASYLVDQGI